MQIFTLYQQSSFTTNTSQPTIKNYPAYLQLSLSYNDYLENIHWINSHEFVYQSKRFDLINKQISYDKIIIHCYDDETEATLINNLGGFSEHNKHFPAKQINPISEFYLPGFSIPSPSSKNFTTHFKQIQFALSSHTLPTDIPPPKLGSAITGYNTILFI